jgi:hypothetical protein
VAKLRGARERKRTTQGKCEGRKSLAEKRPEAVKAAHALNDGRSLDKISAGLAGQGFTTPSGKPYSASAVKGMLGKEFKSLALIRRMKGREGSLGLRSKLR